MAILRHSRIQTTLDLYTQGDNDETRAAQGEFLKARRHAVRSSAMKLWVGLWVEVFRLFAAQPLKDMIGTRRLELLTSTVSG
jgi:hypothetical protein